MKLSISNICKQIQPLSFQGGLNIDSFLPRKDKVIFVMGATGTGKSRLAIDLANRFPAEIINSDKMQVYKGLDIATNKVTEEECRGVPHHLLGVINPNVDFTAADFRHQTSSTIQSIVNRDRLPIIAGGSNSYIDALVNHDIQFRLKYECCFLWVDVLLPVLRSFVSNRVDKMVRAGLIDEVRQIFNPEADYTTGIRRAIGVPELDEYLRAEKVVNSRTRARMLKKAIDKIKENTCMLACRQLQKIHKLHSQWKWRMHRLDATEVFLKSGDAADEAWEELIAAPSTMIVNQFMYEKDCVTATTVGPADTAAMPAVMAAAAR